MSDNCPCYDSVISEARSNAVHQAYMILVDCAALGFNDEKPPRSALFHGALSVMKCVIDDHYGESERKELTRLMNRLSTTAIHFTVLEYADEQSKGH